MSCLIVNVTRSEEVLQGDIFKITNSDNELFSKGEVFVFIVTADCDIANNKMGNYYSVLPIISAEFYLENYWVKEFFKKENEKILTELVSRLNKSEYIKNQSYDPLTSQSLQKWLGEESLGRVVETLNLKESFKGVDGVGERLLLIKNSVGIDCYVNYRKLSGVNDRNIIKDMMSALKNCREEFYFLPQVSSKGSLGSVIKLREIRPVHKSKLFLDETSERLSPSTINNIVRICRLPDNLRYSISQTFALLFSRIGLSTEFEKNKNESISMISENIMSKYNDV